MTSRPAPCAVAVPVADKDAAAQAEAAIAALTPSPYLTARPLLLDPRLGEPAWRNAAIEAAAERGDDWIFFLAEGERVSPALLELLAPALGPYDAVWGGIGVPGEDGAIDVPRLARFSGSSEVRAFHMALHWWVGRSHLMRVAAAQAEPFSASAGNGWHADYLLRHWVRHRCLKTAQPLTLAPALPPVAEADKAALLTELEKRPREIRFQHGDVTVRLPYTGRNPTLERIQLRGVFYEAAELAALRARIAPGAVIIDVGANTGNHTVYFAAIMRAARVVPVEPGASACAALRWAIEMNALSTVDTAGLGKAAGAQAAKADMRMGGRGHLGTASLSLSHAGDVPVLPLDDLVEGPVDLIKIDAEGMEDDILAGAGRILARSRPILMIEVADDRLASFLPLIRQLGYAVEDIFPDEGYANYLLVPDERRH